MGGDDMGFIQILLALFAALQLLGVV